MVVLCGVSLTFAACTTSNEAVAPVEPETTTTTAPEVPFERPNTIRIGIAVNEAAPTALFDAQIETILAEAALGVTEATGVSIDLRSVSIERTGQANGTVSSLINDGVSVIITGCDDATVPSVVEAATGNELLAVTGCMSLPRPDIDRLGSEIDDDLFIDLSDLSDSADAIANFVQGTLDASSVGVIASDLFPDVERTCIDLVPDGDADAISTSDGGALLDVAPLSTTFTELLDAPTEVVSELQSSAGDETLDAIVICALPPTVGDVVGALRIAGFDQPIVLPWHADGQQWDDATTNVFVVTPASRYGDDPAMDVNELFQTLADVGEEPNAVDVVTADTLRVLANAATAGGSVGSRSLADTIRNSAAFPVEGIDGLSGALITSSTDHAVERVYRVIEIEDGEPSFLTEVG